MRRLAFALLIATSLTACSNPNAPEPINGAAEWARQHINEMCVAFGGAGGQGIYGPARLIPLNQPVPSGGFVVAISYCNPAE